MLSRFLVAVSSALIAAISASAIAQTTQPDAKPAPAATPATDAKPDPKLLPWRDRIPPKKYGLCLGYGRGTIRALDLVVEMHPELAGRVQTAKQRREKWLGVGLLAVEDVFRKIGFDVEDLLKTQVLTAEQDQKFRDVIKANLDQSLEAWGNFERSFGSIEPVSLLYSLDPAHEADPGLAIRENLLVSWSGSRESDGDRILVETELPVGWTHGGVPKDGNIVSRMVSLAGYGDEIITIIAERIPNMLTPEQETAFWAQLLDKQTYAKVVPSVIELGETKIGSRKAVQVTLRSDSKSATLNSRHLFRQIAFLEGRWTVTIQLMRSTHAKPDAELPSEADLVKELARFDPVWRKMLDSLRIEASEKPKLPEAAAPVEKPAEKQQLLIASSTAVMIHRMRRDSAAFVGKHAIYLLPRHWLVAVRIDADVH